MKFLKSILVLFMSFIVMSASSQTVSANAYLGTNSTHLLGGDLFVTLKNGMVFGVGGSHATRAIYTNKNYQINGWNGWEVIGTPRAKEDPFFKHYTAERGTLTGLFGYSFGNTTLMGETGVSFRQEIVEGNSVLNEAEDVDLRYQSRLANPGFLYGMTVTQNFGGRFGVMLGYNNIQSLKFGLSYKITPTSMFKD